MHPMVRSRLWMIVGNENTKVHAAECWERTGKAPIKSRWIDINKGDSKNPLHRSRLVGKEFNDGKDPTLFAATPPLEALKVLVSDAATVERGRKGGDTVILIDDVFCVHCVFVVCFHTYPDGTYSIVMLLINTKSSVSKFGF